MRLACTNDEGFILAVVCIGLFGIDDIFVLNRCQFLESSGDGKISTDRQSRRELFNPLAVSNKG